VGGENLPGREGLNTHTYLYTRKKNKKGKKEKRMQNTNRCRIKEKPRGGGDKKKDYQARNPPTTVKKRPGQGNQESKEEAGLNSGMGGKTQKAKP